MVIYTKGGELMKRILALMVLFLLLVGCGQSQKQTGGEEKVIEPTKFEKEMEHNLFFSMELKYDNPENVTVLDSGKFQLGEPIGIKVKVKNKGEKDYKFKGDPCEGKLSVSLHSDKIKASGEGDISTDFCVKSLVEHTIKAGETMTATATFPLDKGSDLTATDADKLETELVPGTYTISARYARQTMNEKIELVEQQ